MQHPHYTGGKRACKEAPEDGSKKVRSEEPPRANKSILDASCVVRLEFLTGPLAEGVCLPAADVVELGGDDPAHNAVVYG